MSLLRPEIAEEAGVLVEQRVDLGRAQLLLRHHVQEDRGVDVAAAAAHHEALEGGEAHRGVHRAAAPDGGDRAAVAEVAGDDAQPGVARPAEDLRRAAGHEAVRGAVEAVAPDAVALVEHVGQGVEEGHGLHGLVERGVEHRHVRHVAEEVPRRPVALDVRRVVQRRDVEALLDRPQHLVVDQHRGLEALAPVHHPVPDRLDLAPVPDDTRLLAGQEGQHALDGDLVLEDLGGLLDRGAPLRLVAQDGGPPDVLDQPLGERAVGARGGRGLVGLDELELHGGAAAVEDQDLHGVILPPGPVSPRLAKPG